MRRRFLIGLLALGTFVGYASGFASLSHRARWCHHGAWGEEYRYAPPPPPVASAPCPNTAAAAPAPSAAMPAPSAAVPATPPAPETPR